MHVMPVARLRYLIAADLYRLEGRTQLRDAFKWYWKQPGFRFLVWFRLCAFSRSRPLLKYVLCPLARWRLWQLTCRFGISIPPDTDIDAGFYIGHFGGIVVNGACRIGRNCNISQGVTLGGTNRGARKGCPHIGNQVYIGPGAKVIGGVRVGDHAAIGANSVVTRDVPENAVVVGVPARIISQNGAQDYVERIDYDAMLEAA